MKTIERNEIRRKNIAPKGLLFLVFLLTIQLFSCGQAVGWTDTDETAPSVKFVTPADDSTGVAINASISATFSETMDTSTFSTSSFTLYRGTTAVTGTVVYSGKTAIFTPKIILDPETEYVATVTKEVKDLAGNFLAQDFEWTFTTGETPETFPPQVIATIPFGDATGAALDTEISAVFSEIMNPLTITEDNFTLFDGNAPIEGEVSYTGVTATFTPENNLDQNRLYTATIHTGVTDLTGNEMVENFVWAFTTRSALDDIRPTVISTIPADEDIDIALNTKVSAVFSEAINPLTINDETFTLKDGTAVIEGSAFMTGNTVIFDPENDLTPETEYTTTITNTVTDLAGNAMEEDFVWKFTTGLYIDNLPPAIISTIPLDEATDVAVGTDISAEFSEAMNGLTINGLTFLVVDEMLAPVSGVINYDPLTKTATFNPDNDLDLDTEYTVTITTGVENITGTAMEMDYIWTFTTDDSPFIISTIPLNNAMNVSTGTDISTEFSEAMNGLTITDLTFMVKDSALAPVSGVINYDALTKTATFNPDNNLDLDTEYTVTITTGVENITGTPMEMDYIWTFTTDAAPNVVSTIPLNNAINVSTDTDISAEFSEAMNGVTITDLTFLVVDEMLAPVEGVINYDAITKIATFNPDSDLLFDTEYTVTITTGVTDLAGNAMGGDFVWTFTTASEIVPPTIISTIPLDNATNVALNTDISAEFSEAMNGLTVTDLTFLVTDDEFAPVSGIITYDAITKIATFNPDNDLLFDTEYTVTITTGATDLAGNAMGEDFIWTFTTASEIVPPTIISTIPLNNAMNVSTGTDISAEFSEAMNGLTINGLTFLVVDEMLAPVSGVINYDPLTKTATFNPDNDLDLDTEYTVTITTGVENITGTAMEMDYIWTFTTDDSPFIISTIPLNNAMNVSTGTDISTEFSEAMNGLTITDLTFMVKDSALAPVSGVINYDALTKTATFNPDNNLDLDTEYTVTITTGVENTTGTSMENDFIWTFRTGVGAVNLKLASPFVIASAAGIDNTGSTHVNGDVVLDPNFTCNDVPGVHDGGFGLCGGNPPTISGTVITNQYPDTITSAAIMADLKAAYQSIMKANLPGAIILGCGIIGSNGGAGALTGCAGNSTLAPGVYISATDSSIGIAGILTLDGLGDSNAEFIFQAPSSTLITAPGVAGSEIRLINGAKASNVWWQVGSSATIGAYSVFQGNILADTSITMGTGATSCGRLLAGAITTTGAFVFDSNLVSVPGNGCPK